MKPKLTKREQARFDKITAKLIDVLRLGEWRIDVAFASLEEISEALGDNPSMHAGVRNLGFSWWDADEAKACIGVAWPQLHKDAEAEWEDTLIHEFVHIRLGGHEYCEGRSAINERNVNLVTRLVRQVIGV